MPYIASRIRSLLDKEIHDLAMKINHAGELNYTITKLCHLVAGKETRSYNTFNKIIGVLECVKLELYRRIVVPYEDEKIEENGDV